MKKYPFLLMCLISAVTAIVVIVILKYFEFDTIAVIGGAAAGGVAGALSSSFLGRNKK